MALGGLAGIGSILSGNKTQGNNVDCDAHITKEELHLERQVAANKLSDISQMYEWRIGNLKELTDAMFQSYQRDVDNSFKLYKYDRDNYDILNQKLTDATFNLYKNQRDEKDALSDKIAALQSKVDVMQAIRPYQDALINAKIDNNALVADYNLSRRTCRMIEGQLVLPNSPEVTGYTSYNTCYCSGE